MKVRLGLASIPGINVPDNIYPWNRVIKPFRNRLQVTKHITVKRSFQVVALTRTGEKCIEMRAHVQHDCFSCFDR